MNQIPDCNTTVESTSSVSQMGGSSSDFEVIMQSAQLDELKQASDQLVSELSHRPDMIKVHSDLENAAPVIKVRCRSD